MQENSLPGIVLTLIVCNPDLKLFFCLRSIRINTVIWWFDEFSRDHQIETHPNACAKHSNRHLRQYQLRTILPDLYLMLTKVNSYTVCHAYSDKTVGLFRSHDIQTACMVLQWNPGQSQANPLITYLYEPLQWRLFQKVEYQAYLQLEKAAWVVACSSWGTETSSHKSSLDPDLHVHSSFATEYCPYHTQSRVYDQFDHQGGL